MRTGRLVRAVCLFAAMGIFLAPVAEAATRRVPSEYPILQEAIAACSPGDTVLVAPGTYTGAGNKALDFGGVDLVLRSEAGPEETILDCQGEGIGASFQGGETREAKLEGITIRDAEPGGDAEGAITCFGSGPTIESCVIEGSGGTGIYSVDGAILLVGSTVVGCSGAGIRTIADGVEITGCTITGNGRIANPYGGGVMISTKGEVRISGCVIEGNKAATGAGIACWNLTGTTRIEDCEIAENEAVTGGGIATVIRGEVEVVRCSLIGNVASGRGGGIYGGIDGVSIAECVVAGNEALRGGGVYGSGSISAVDCLITGNLSLVEGGGVYAEAGSPDYVGTTISGNRASSGRGGGLFAGGAASARFERTILWSNCAAGPEGGHELYVIGGGRVELACSLTDSGLVAGPGDVIWGEDNLFEDPLFCAHEECWSAPTPAGDYSLAGGGTCASPCLPQTSPCGERVGAVGAGPCGCTATVRTTWGRIKLLHLPSIRSKP